MTSSGASDTDSARKRTSGCSREHAADHGLTAAVGHVHVDEHDVGAPLADHLDGGVDLRRLADDVGVVAELGAHAAAEQVVVVDEEHPHGVPVALGHARVRVASTARPRCPGPGATGSPRAAVALHAARDRLGDAAAVGRDAGGIEPATAVADEHRDLVGLHLDVDRDRRRARVTRPR